MIVKGLVFLRSGSYADKLGEGLENTYGWYGMYQP